MKSNKNKFIDFLDSHSTNGELSSIDYSLLTTLINSNFDNTKLNDKNMIGNLYKPTILNDASLNNAPSIWSNHAMQPNYAFIDTSYYLWQAQHEANIDFYKGHYKDETKMPEFTRFEKIEAKIT